MYIKFTKEEIMQKTVSKRTCNKNFQNKNSQCSQAVNKCGYVQKGMAICNEAHMKMLNI
jgi:hypothetical protein